MSDQQTEFVSFPKMPRLFREVVVTCKLDGTNAQIFIHDDGATMQVGSRNRWITPENDNYSFARWAEDNKAELLKLGPGRHFGEWFGAGIQRRYGLAEKRFALFNTGRWMPTNESGPGVSERANPELPGPNCCYVVPILYQGPFNEVKIRECLDRLRNEGSIAAPGFMQPEGIIVYHTAAKQYFKITLDGDAPKGAQ
jgi:hypothetical protein